MEMYNIANLIYYDKKGTQLDKEELIKSYIEYMLCRTIHMFEYENLPSTIPRKDLEILLQINGSATISEVDGELYAFRGGLGGMLNEYYLPTLSVVSNPYLKFTKVLNINEDCVVMLNDSMYKGLLPMFKKYSNLLAELDISFQFCFINTRIRQVIVTNNDKDKASADKWLKDLWDGKKLGALINEDFMNDIKTLDFATNNNDLKYLIETYHYLKGQWYIDLGVNASFNMKREALTSEEINMNNDNLVPLIDDMLDSRRKACEQINKKYGTNITVDLSSSWKQMRTIEKLEMEKKQAEVKEIVDESSKEVIETKVEEGGMNDGNPTEE